MSNISIYPIPSTRIKVQGAADSQHEMVKLAHVYALLALYVFKYSVQSSDQKLTDFFGPWTSDKQMQILHYLDEAIVWFENTLFIYDIQDTYQSQEFQNVYALVHDEQGQTGKQCPAELTLLICSQFWKLNQEDANTLSLLAGSIFHEVVTFAGLPTRWGVFTNDDAKQLVKLDQDGAVRCAANYMYALQAMIPTAKELVEVYSCTLVSITCEHPSEFNQWGERNDEIYLKKNGSKVWPGGKYESITFKQTLTVNQPFVSSMMQSDSFELWDVDDVSSDDKLYTFTLQPGSTIYGESRSSSTEQLLSQAKEGQKYVFFGTKEGGDSEPQAYYITFSLDRKELGIVSPVPAPKPPDDIIHDEL